jgi:hypothetical protein
MVQRKASKPDTANPARQPTGRDHVPPDRVRHLPPPEAPAPRQEPQRLAISPEHSKESDDFGPLMRMLGTTDRNFAKGLYGQLISASGRGIDKLDGDGLLFVLGTIKATKPRDELEAMQISQMAAVHAAMMKVAGDLARAEYLPERDSATRALNQLARTYTAQLDALKRYRSGAEQTVTVQNVSVSEGGQAIVGNVTQAAGAAPEKVATAPPALTDARQPAMEILSESERMHVQLHVKRKT